jgi:hypothetical protein
MVETRVDEEDIKAAPDAPFVQDHAGQRSAMLKAVSFGSSTTTFQLSTF